MGVAVVARKHQKNVRRDKGLEQESQLGHSPHPPRAKMLPRAHGWTRYACKSLSVQPVIKHPPPQPPVTLRRLLCNLARIHHITLMLRSQTGMRRTGASDVGLQGMVVAGRARVVAR